MKKQEKEKKTAAPKSGKNEKPLKKKETSSSSRKAASASSRQIKEKSQTESVKIKKAGSDSDKKTTPVNRQKKEIITAPEDKPVKKKTPEKELYNLLTQETDKDNTPEEIDPESLARGDKPMSVVDHLDELRSRILVILSSFFILTFVAFYYSDILVEIVNKPFLDTGNKLNIFRIVGGFMIKLKVSAAAALFALIPLIIFQIWRFIVPAIEKKNRTFSRLTILAAIILFYSGVAFVFFLLVPAAIKVMLSFIGTEMISTIGADDYLSFIIFFSIIMGIIFEIPIIILVLTRLGLVSPQFLVSKRKHMIVIIWILAAVVTPPDPLSQALVGIPLMILYEISILISKLISRREIKKLNI